MSHQPQAPQSRTTGFFMSLTRMGAQQSLLQILVPRLYKKILGTNPNIFFHVTKLRPDLSAQEFNHEDWSWTQEPNSTHNGSFSIKEMLGLAKYQAPLRGGLVGHIFQYFFVYFVSEGRTCIDYRFVIHIGHSRKPMHFVVTKSITFDSNNCCVLLKYRQAKRN